jgi:hypothetical protein
MLKIAAICMALVTFTVPVLAQTSQQNQNNQQNNNNQQGDGDGAGPNLGALVLGGLALGVGILVIAQASKKSGNPVSP